MVRALMRLEGMCVALLSVAGYFGLHLDWVAFLSFVLVSTSDVKSPIASDSDSPKSPA